LTDPVVDAQLHENLSSWLRPESTASGGVLSPAASEREGAPRQRVVNPKRGRPLGGIGGGTNARTVSFSTNDLVSEDDRGGNVLIIQPRLAEAGEKALGERLLGARQDGAEGGLAAARF
jgi:hypothetical protein